MIAQAEAFAMLIARNAFRSILHNRRVILITISPLSIAHIPCRHLACIARFLLQLFSLGCSVYTLETPKHFFAVADVST